MKTLVFVFTIILCGSAYAETSVLTRCGFLSGHSYYIQGGHVSKDKSGWKSDGMSGRSIVFSVKDGIVDVIFEKPNSPMQFASVNGAEVRLLFVNEMVGGGTKIVISETYLTGGYTTNLYVLIINALGNGKLVWNRLRVTGVIDVASTFVGTCVG